LLATTPMARVHVPEHVSHSVETIATIHVRAQRKVDRHQRLVEVLTATIGRPHSIYVIAAIVAAWILYNVIAPRMGWHRIDEPPFFWLQGALCAASLLVTTMVLTTQNRQTRQNEQRSQLDLQVNLLSEQKIAKIIDLLEELRRDMPTVRDRVDPLAEAMMEAVDPHAVISALEDSLEPKSSDARESATPVSSVRVG
jgi:uncharacterized membrane protein